MFTLFRIKARLSRSSRSRLSAAMVRVSDYVFAILIRYLAAASRVRQKLFNENTLPRRARFLFFFPYSRLYFYRAPVSEISRYVFPRLFRCYVERYTRTNPLPPQTHTLSLSLTYTHARTMWKLTIT